MRKFPAASKSDFELALKIFESFQDEFTTRDLEKAFGVSRSKVYKALSVLSHLNVLAKRKQGRKVIYAINKDFPPESALIGNEFCREVLRLVFNGVRSRKGIADRLGIKNVEKNITGVVSLARMLGIMVRGRSYRLTDRGQLLLFMSYVLSSYRKLKSSAGVYVEIPLLRREVSKYLFLDKEKFDELLVKAWREDPNINLGRVPSGDETILSEAIELEDGYYYYFSYSS